jgi:hypothetical protein
MSRYIIEYISENLLFDEKYLENRFAGILENELRESLNLYRQYCLSQVQNYSPREGIRTNIGYLEGALPSIELIKQMTMYFDSIIVSDPIFEFTYEQSEAQYARSSLFGEQNTQIARKDLAVSIEYILSLRSAIEAGVIEFLPHSYLYEPSEQTPILYSENHFADALPRELMKWFHENAIVHPVKKVETGGLQVLFDEPLEPCRSINVAFKGTASRVGSLYFLSQIETTRADDTTGIIEMYQTFPDTPPPIQQFHLWVAQSLNQAARTFYKQIIMDAQISETINSIYLTSSPFISDTVNKAQLIAKTLKNDVAYKTLDLELPIIKDIQLEDIIRIRQNDGEAFQNFRIYLESKLREVRQIDNPQELFIALENISHELTEVQIREINQKLKQAKRGILADIVVGAAGLLTMVQTGGLSLSASLIAAWDFQKKIDQTNLEIRENPALFLWKLQKIKK